MTISGMEMVRDFPLTGVGLDMVDRLYPLYRRDDAPRWRVPHLHNNPVQIAAERGLPALAAYLWLHRRFLRRDLAWARTADGGGPRGGRGDTHGGCSRSPSQGCSSTTSGLP